MRIFAISDLHVDFRENLQWVNRLSDCDYRDDVLLIAGDVSHRLDRVTSVFETLNEKFAHLFFVPGNHDLWVREKEVADSIEKFHRLMAVCDDLQVITKPKRMNDVWVVPLLSWYRLPEWGADSLFVPKDGEDPSLRMWSDNVFIQWPIADNTVVNYFLDLNTFHISKRVNDMPVLTMSHFLPRQELVFGNAVERQKMRPGSRDPHPGFNFSRVAGTSLLDDQIRTWGAHLHVYGHQHRNRDRVLDGVRYVSHCLGYRRERVWNLVCHLDEGPKQIWPFM